MPVNQRFNNNAPSTGVKNHSKPPALRVVVDATILVISTCNWCSGWQNAYLRYRHLWGKLYEFIGKCGEIKEGLLDFGFGIANSGFIKGLFSYVKSEIRNPKFAIPNPKSHIQNPFLRWAQF
jgi:hypothetical protein